MRRLELLESKLTVVFGTDLTLRDLRFELCYCAVELLLIGSFEVSMLVSIEESDEVWNGCYLEGLCTISSYLSVDSSDDQV